MIRTSKSKQYAFEVVMREKTPLLLACDNEILLNEWITAFTDVMDIVHRVQMGGSYGTNNSLQRYGGSAFFTGIVLYFLCKIKMVTDWFW